MVKLDVVNLLEIFLHVCFAQRFLVRFLGDVSKREVNSFKVSSNQHTINLVGSGVVFCNYCDSAFFSVAAIILSDDLFFIPALSELVINYFHN